MKAQAVLRGAALVGLAALVACTPQRPTAVRDLSAPISATSRFEAQAFAGPWQVVARFVPSGPALLRVVAGPQPGRLRIESAALPGLDGTYREGVPGELIAVEGARENVIVLWVDEDFETAAIGTVSGSFGAVLDRDGFVPPDRAKAARDIFQFYGWDVSALRETAE